MRAHRRPFLSASITEIEAALERAKADGDASALQAITHELTFRRVPKARDLAARLKQTDLGAPGKYETAGRSRPSDPHVATEKPKATGRAGAGAGRSEATGASYTPTAEQQAAIDAFSTGGSLRINAFAGSGKTSTLQMLAKADGRRGQYIAFNKSIVSDAKSKFPDRVNCSTSHALAFRATPALYRGNTQKMTGKVNAQKLADILDLKKRWRIDHDHVLQARSQAFLILDTVRRFAQSAEDEISDAHVPRHGSLLSAGDEVIAEVTEFARRGAEHVWARMCDPADELPLGHDGYLKLWALSRPQIAADYILLDEAQDTNPVVLDVLRRQDAQLVYVGDRHQQIYEWRGAVNAMAAMPTDHSVSLTLSFRFGPEIAAAATRLLYRLGETSPLVGNSSIQSRVGPCRPDTILARTNANVMASLITALNEQRRPHLVGGTSELMAMLRGVGDLKAGTPSTVPEFFGFQNWQEVVAFAETQEGQHLLTFVNLVQARGEKQLMWALNRTVDENKADLILSTAHKAKGREWSKVQVMDDFLAVRPPKPGAVVDQAKADSEFAAELRLFYVAVTRARDVIDIPGELADKVGLAAEKPAGRPLDARKPPPAARPAPNSWTPPKDWRPEAAIAAAPQAPSPPISKRPTPAKSGFLQWLFGTR